MTSIPERPQSVADTTWNYLLVDDSPIIRTVLKRCLDLSGLAVGTVWQAGDGIEALRVLRTEPVDCVFCDLHMPRLDGMGVLRRLADAGRLPELRVVVVSSDRCRDRIASLLELGVRAFITKPFSPDRIREVIGEVIAEGEDQT